MLAKEAQSSDSSPACQLSLRACARVPTCSVAYNSLWPMDYSPPGSTVHGILQARILEWVAISYSRRPSLPRHRTRVSCVSCSGGKILYHWATWEAPSKSVYPCLNKLSLYFLNHSTSPLNSFTVKKEPQIHQQQDHITTGLIPLWDLGFVLMAWAADVGL